MADKSEAADLLTALKERIDGLKLLSAEVDKAEGMTGVMAAMYALGANTRAFLRSDECAALLRLSASQLCDCCERPLGDATTACPHCGVRFAASPAGDGMTEKQTESLLRRIVMAWDIEAPMPEIMALIDEARNGLGMTLRDDADEILDSIQDEAEREPMRCCVHGKFPVRTPCQMCNEFRR